MLVEDFSRRIMADSQKEGLEGLPVCEKNGDNHGICTEFSLKQKESRCV